MNALLLSTVDPALAQAFIDWAKLDHNEHVLLGCKLVLVPAEAGARHPKLADHVDVVLPGWDYDSKTAQHILFYLLPFQAGWNARMLQQTEQLLARL